MKKISDSTVRRLSKYLRLLSHFENQGLKTVSSEKMAAMEGITSAQVRKDLSCFGSFGRRGLGYNVSNLKNKIGDILGLNKPWNVALVGVGNLGTALIDYQEFQKRQFYITAVFDNDPKKIGKKIKGMEILDVNRMPEIVKQLNISIAILTVPGEVTQAITNFLADAGIKGILNFAPKTLASPEGITVRSEDTSTELEALTYYLTNT